jgi:hypothetical protein
MSGEKLFRAKLAEARRRIYWTNVSINAETVARHGSPEDFKRTSATDCPTGEKGAELRRVRFTGMGVLLAPRKVL